MTDLFNKINNLLLKNTNKLPQKIAVALSGGCDSMALTFILQEFCQKNQIELIAITIDHQFRSNSSQEAEKVGEILRKNKISHHIAKIPKENLPKSNIESNLRNLRYQLLHDVCHKNNIGYLFLGHHLGDVAENFLIRLFRGSGLDGLSIINEINQYHNIFLIRPLLDFHKDDLKNYLQNKNINWFEDETNDDDKFLRNKIRNFLSQLPESNLIQTRIKRTSEDISQIRDFFDEEVAKNAKESIKFQDNCYLIHIDNFKKIRLEIALKILALILMEIGQKPYKPRLTKLKNFYNYIVKDAEFKRRNFYGCILDKYNKEFLAIYYENNHKVKRLSNFEQSKIKKFLDQ